MPFQVSQASNSLIDHTPPPSVRKVRTRFPVTPDDVNEVLELVSSLILCFQETYEAKATVIVDEKIEIQATIFCRLLHGTAKIRMNQLAIILCSDAVSREWRPLCFSIGTILARFGWMY